MSKFFLGVAVRRLSAQRLALVALCVVAGVALAASSAAVAGTPGGTPGRVQIQVVNDTDNNLPCCTVQLQAGSWQTQPRGPLGANTSDIWVAAPGVFAANVDYGPANQGPGFQAKTDVPPYESNFTVICDAGDQVTCQVQKPTTTMPWTVTFGPGSDDATPPVVQVRVAPSLLEESVRAAGVPVVVRSNEPARARVELLAQSGARHALLVRPLKWGNRDYPLMLRLNRAGLRALDVGRLYRLRVQVTDRKGNRAQTIERIFIR